MADLLDDARSAYFTTRVLPEGICRPLSCVMACSAICLLAYVTKAQPRDFALLLRNTYSSRIWPTGENRVHKSSSVAWETAMHFQACKRTRPTSEAAVKI